MNIVQLHDKVRFWLDYVGSARFDNEDIDRSLNSAVNQIWREKYDRTKRNHITESFESTQAVRDELREFIAFIDKDSTPSISLAMEAEYVKVTGLPSDYRYMLGIALICSTVRYVVYPLTRNRKQVDPNNPFRRVTENAFNRCYFEEVSDGVKVYHPFSASYPTNVEIEYLKAPTNVSFGTEYSASGVANDTPCIATMTPTSFNGVVLSLGDEFDSGGAPVFSYGAYTAGFVNPQLNSALHEELAVKAAINCLIAAGGEQDKQKIQLLMGEVSSL